MKVLDCGDFGPGPDPSFIGFLVWIILIVIIFYVIKDIFGKK